MLVGLEQNPDKAKTKIKIYKQLREGGFDSTKTFSETVAEDHERLGTLPHSFVH